MKNNISKGYPINRPVKAEEIYIDCEWFMNQEIYLLGYAYDLRHFAQLWGSSLNRDTVEHIFKGVKRIYFWGPDIGMVEKCFNIELRGRFLCINLLRAMKTIEPTRRSYKLAHFERLAGLKRSVVEYKSNIFNLHRDWLNPKYRDRALLYNREDVLLMLQVKRFFFKKNKVKVSDLSQWQLL